MSTTITKAALLALLVTGSAPCLAQAQQAPARGAPATTTAPPAAAAPAPRRPESAGVPRPDRTTASYGDWVLRCELAAGGGESSCEVAQTVLDGRGQALAQLTARGVALGQVALTAQVGINIAVSEPMRLLVEDQPALILAFRRCFPRGCFAEGQLPEGDVGTLARRAEAAKLDFRDAEGNTVSVPVSLRGLAPALEALRAARG